MPTREFSMEKDFWFKSEKFPIEKGEDEETNPLCFGKSLAAWLCQKFSELGYETEVIPEDWGWCVMCESNGYLLWLGCGSMTTEELMENYSGSNPPKGSEVVWHVFSAIEIPFFDFKTLFQKWTGKINLDTPLKKLDSSLESVLKSEPAVVFCDEP